MKTGNVKKMKPAERFLYWVRERYAIYQRRLAGGATPWTDDTILQTYRFCNVRRMDDRVSRWLLENWYEPYRDHPNMLYATTLARNFNLPTTLTAITDRVFRSGPPDWEGIKRGVRQIKDAGLPVFNGAYMVRGMSKSERYYTPIKSDQVVDRMTRPLWDKRVKVDPSSMRISWEALLPQWGFASFMAGQVVADLRWAVPGRWADRRSWAPIGPGSARGMNRLQNRPPNQRLNQDQFIEELGTLMEASRAKLSQVALRMEAIDWQNCLCEFDKYERALQGEGKPKQLYHCR